MSLFGWLHDLWKKRQEDKKFQELYARLDRNANGKFSKKQYIKDATAAMKAEKNKK